MTDNREPQVYWITEYLAIGPRHASGGPSMAHLGKLGFRQVIDLNKDPDEQQEALKIGFEYHGLSIKDQASAEDWLAAFSRSSELIRTAHSRGEKVYLHCTYGVGRSPAVAMAYLISAGSSMDDAIELVKRKSPDTWNPGNPVSKYSEILRVYSKREAKKTRLSSSFKEQKKGRERVFLIG